MLAFTAKLAAAISVTAALAAPVLAAPSPVETVATIADESVQVAAYCEYVILWDAWGNAYYEYYCY